MNVEKLFWDFYKAPVENEVESDLTHYLDKAPDLPPDPEDELPRE